MPTYHQTNPRIAANQRRSHRFTLLLRALLVVGLALLFWVMVAYVPPAARGGFAALALILAFGAEKPDRWVWFVVLVLFASIPL